MRKMNKRMLSKNEMMSTEGGNGAGAGALITIGIIGLVIAAAGVYYQKQILQEAKKDCEDSPANDTGSSAGYRMPDEGVPNKGLSPVWY